MPHARRARLSRTRRTKVKRVRPAGERARKRRSAGKVKLDRNAAFVVELALKVDDGWEKDSKTICLKSHSAPRRGKPESGLIRRRQLAAKRVAGRCRSRQLARLLGAVAHAQRLAILRELLAGEATHKVLAKLTKLKAGPLYYHIRELRTAGLIGPKVRDLYVLTRRGRRLLLGLLAMERLTR